MSDAVNMIALAKMAVIVIGVFLVPMITRKFAADLGAPVGQMAMNRAAIASAALGVGTVKLGMAGSQTLLSHAGATSLPKVGRVLRSVGQSLNPNESGSHETFSSPKPGMVRRASAATFEKLGKHLEEAKVRHDAKKAGITPPTFKDHLLKRISVDPQITGPITAREQRYQKFLKSQTASPESYLPHAVNAGPRSTPPQNSYSHPPADRGPDVLFEGSLKNSGSDFTSKPNGRPALQMNQTGFASESHLDRMSARENLNIPSATENSWLKMEVQKTNHRWLNSTRLERLFQSPKNDSERKDR